MDWYGDIDLKGGAILNFFAEQLASDPVFVGADEGRIIYNTTEKSYKYNNGSSWVAFEISATSSDAFIDALGNNWIDSDLTFIPTDFNSLNNVSGLTTSSSLYNVLTQLDTAITNALAVTTLQGVNLDFTSGDLSNKNIIYYNGTDFVVGSINDVGLVELAVNELSDTDINNAQDAQFLVYDDGMWVNKPVFYKQDFLSGTVNTFTVNHNLGQQICHVTVADRGVTPSEVITPSAIRFNTENTLTVELNSNKQVTILVSTLEGI